MFFRTSFVLPSLLTLALLCVGGPALAQPVLGYDDLQVNSYTTGDQLAPTVVVKPDGSAVVTWSTAGAESGQRVTARDDLAGSAFDVTSLGEDITDFADGSVAVVNEQASDGSATGIGLRLFSSTGAALGSELVVNTYTTGVQSEPSVTTNLLGKWVAVWSGAGSTGNDSSGLAVHGRVEGQGAEFQVNSLTAGAQSAPSVDGSPDAGFVVAWQSGSSAGTDADGLSIQARRFDLDGNPLAPEFQVNSYTTGNQLAPSVAVDAANRFVVVWENGTLGARGFTQPTISAQLLSAGGTPVGAELTLTTPGAVGFAPEVEVPIIGPFAVVWSNFLGPNVDVGGALVDENNGALVPGGRFVVNQYTPGLQGSPRISAGRLGEFVVVFESDSSQGGDTSGTSIQLRRFGARTFDNGFETGDFAGWAEAVGAT